MTTPQVTRCPACAEQIPSGATSCPHCKEPLTPLSTAQSPMVPTSGPTPFAGASKPGAGRKWAIIVILAVVVVAAVVGAVFGLRAHRESQCLDQLKAGREYLCEQAKAALSASHRTDVKEVLGDCELHRRQDIACAVKVSLRVRADVYKSGRITPDVEEVRKVGAKCICANQPGNCWVCSPDW